LTRLCVISFSSTSYDKKQKTMKRIIIVLIALCLFQWTQAATAETKIPSKIKEVTVFQRGAQVSRTGQTNIAKGQSILIFSGISPQIDPNSIQFSSVGNFTILSINHKLDYLTPPEKDEKLEGLKTQRENFSDQLAEEKAILSVFQEEENLIIANKSLASQQNGVDIENLKATAEFYRSRIKEIRLEKLTINKSIRQLQEEIKKVDQQLQTLKAKYQPKATSEVWVTVSADQVSRATFTLTYLINNAGWTPLYDIRVKDINSPAQLQYKAKVYQNSGEDWDQVRLSLSTGNPRQSGTRPILTPWWLYTSPPVAYRNRIRKQDLGQADFEVIEEEAAEADEFRGKKEVQASYANATTVENTTSWEFQIRLPYDVPSNGQPYTVGIDEHELPATYEYYVAPKLDKNAYLTAKVTNWEEFRLLSGTANLFFEGTFLGQSHLDVASTQDTLAISLGQDKGIVVERTRDEQFKDRQFIGSKQTQKTGWKIKIRNKKRQAINLVVFDQIPLSTSDQVEVKLAKSKGAKFDEKTGELKWELELAANTSEEIGFQYSVKHPKKMALALE